MGFNTRISLSMEQLAPSGTGHVLASTFFFLDFFSGLFLHIDRSVQNTLTSVSMISLFREEKG